MKKIIIISVIVVLAAGVTLYLIPWGGAESEVVKSKLKTEAPDNNTIETEVPVANFENLEGLYKAAMAEEIEEVTSEIMFNIDALQGTVGKFKAFEIELSKNSSTAELTVNIDVSSIYTANKMRDEGIRGEGFFEVEKYPTMAFHSETIEKTDTGYVAKGFINMMGIDKEIDVPFVFKGLVDNPETEIAVFEGNFVIDRTEFGMEHTASVGDEVSVNFYTELKKAK